LRQLLTAKIIASIIQDMTMCGAEKETDVPQEHIIECICELLQAIGATFESMPMGKPSLVMVCSRLMELKVRKVKDKHIYSKRIQFGIQDLLDTRAKGWERKVFKIKAKTIEEVRVQQEKEIRDKERGVEISTGAETQIAGQRPAYLLEAESKRNADEKWTDAPGRAGKRR